MKLKNKILFSVAALIGSLGVMNFVYSITTAEQDKIDNSPIYSVVQTGLKKNPEIIYLGESSNITYRDNDLDKRPISGILKDFYPDLEIGNLTKEASHARVYYYMLKQIPEKNSVKTVIVTLNFRSFDADWINSKLENAISKGLVMVSDGPVLYNRFRLGFKAFEHKTDRERNRKIKSIWKKDILEIPANLPYKTTAQWDSTMAYTGIKNPDGSLNEKATQLACNFIKNFAFLIDTTSNPRIRDFDNIVELARKRGWNLVFNLMAENVELANTLVGKELTDLMLKNKEFIKARYEKKGVTIVDNFTIVADKEFIDRDWPTEHYAETGRKQIAKNVALAIKKFHSKSFQEKDENSLAFSFKNDCEGEVIWAQMQTLSEDKAYSGDKSSKVTKEDPYSVGLEYPVNQLADSIATLQFNAMIFRNTGNKNAKLVIDLIPQNEALQRIWIGVSLEELKITPGSWTKLSYPFNLPANYKEYHLIKAFILNEETTPVYVDDIFIDLIPISKAAK
jgi:hypothetical protein